MKIKLLLLIISTSLLFSCRTTNQITYFQDLADKYPTQIESPATYDTKIMADDLLSITVSSIQPNSVAIFNLPLTSYDIPGSASLIETPVMQSYLVDSQGNINFPVLGRLHVAGMTRSEMAEFMKEKISAYAKEPLVTIKILNFKITILGEVASPGTKSVANERVSILDAIGMAGDLTIYGERTNVLLFRDNGAERETYRFDLTSSDIFTSPYFYLQQNDVIYVEPNDARKGNAKYNQRSQYKVSVASTIVGGLSVLISLGIALFLKR